MTRCHKVNPAQRETRGFKVDLLSRRHDVVCPKVDTVTRGFTPYGFTLYVSKGSALADLLLSVLTFHTFSKQLLKKRLTSVHKRGIIRVEEKGEKYDDIYVLEGGREVKCCSY